MNYKRLKSTNGSGTIMRYFDLADGQEAKTNVFYEIVDGKAEEIADGSTPTGTIIGFSHGGDKLVEGKILLDVNPAIVYIASDVEELPTVGAVIDGFKKVLAVDAEASTYEFVIGGAGATATVNAQESDENAGESEGNE